KGVGNAAISARIESGARCALRRVGLCQGARARSELRTTESGVPLVVAITRAGHWPRHCPRVSRATLLRKEQLSQIETYFFRALLQAIGERVVRPGTESRPRRRTRARSLRKRRLPPASD